MIGLFRYQYKDVVVLKKHLAICDLLCLYKTQISNERLQENIGGIDEYVPVMILSFIDICSMVNGYDDDDDDEDHWSSGFGRSFVFENWHRCNAPVICIHGPPPTGIAGE